MHTCGASASYLLASYLADSFIIRDSPYLLSRFSKDFVAHSTLALPEIANNQVLLVCFSVRVVLCGLTHLTQLFSFLTLYMNIRTSPILIAMIYHHHYEILKETSLIYVQVLLNEIRSV